MCKIIYSRILPIGKEANAMAFYPFIVVKKSRRAFFTPFVERHERIHLAQQAETGVAGIILTALVALAGGGWWSLLALPLYLWLYALLFVWKFLGCWNWLQAYQRNPLEIEAYAFQRSPGYLAERKPWAWLSLS